MVSELINRWEVRILLISLFVFALERSHPWRKKQPFLRPQIGQDVIWFLFNAIGLSMMFGFTFGAIAGGLKSMLTWIAGPSILELRLLANMSLPVQILVALVIIDFVEWGIHNLLHRVPWLWRFHRLHHSIHHMDWIGNFRFHPFEIFFYYSIRYIPVLLLGASKEAAIVTGGFSLLIGNLNHSNLNFSYGPLRYIFNSPRMHIWHHDAQMRNRAGVNFGITLSVWDWIFQTAYMPPGTVPKRLGFGGDEYFPDSLWRRFLLPFLDTKK